MTTKIDTVGGNCPVQAEGTIDGQPFYFRARHDHWSIGIGGDVVGNPDWYYEEEYPLGDAGWMTEAEARAFIRQAAEKYSGREKVGEIGGEDEKSLREKDL